MNGRSSQRKGAKAERELARELTAVLGVECRKGSSPYLPGLIAPDVLVPDGVPIHIEAKRRERFSIPAAMRQATEDAPTGHVPLVAHRPNRHPWMLTVRLSDLPRLARIVARIAQDRLSRAGAGMDKDCREGRLR